MSAFDDLAAMGPQDIWTGVAVRAVHGERITFGVVELEPNAVVPEHSHGNEQLGMVLSGSLTFRIGDESRELGPGGTWCIPANAPHEVVAALKAPSSSTSSRLRAATGRAFELQPPRTPRWP